MDYFFFLLPSRFHAPMNHPSTSVLWHIINKNPVQPKGLTYILTKVKLPSAFSPT